MPVSDEQIALLREAVAAHRLSQVERYEAAAERFFRATGIIAPGKSVPTAMEPHVDEVLRRVAWDRWVAERLAAFDAALASLLDEVLVLRRENSQLLIDRGIAHEAALVAEEKLRDSDLGAVVRWLRRVGTAERATTAEWLPPGSEPPSKTAADRYADLLESGAWRNRT